MLTKEISDDYVALAEHVCPVCGCTHTHNTEILINKYLRSIPENKRVTGWGLCKEHQELKDKGYVAFVACDEEKSKLNKHGNINPEDAYRLGPIAHLHKDAYAAIINVPMPEGMVVFCSLEVIDQLKEMQGD